MSMGVIPGKVHLDWHHVEEAMRNGEDGNIGAECYPGGSKDVNHDVMPGDLSIGWKEVRDPTGGFNELGFVSLNGLHMGQFTSQREAEDSVYPQGIVTTECRVSDPMGNSSTQDPDHGYALVKAGTVPTLNNGPKAIFPNNFIAMRFPPSMFNKYLKLTKGDNEWGSATNHRARMGTFASQIRPELVPFDYTDFHIHYDSARAAMELNKEQNGIMNMPLDDVLRRRKGYLSDVPQLSAEQEEAIGHYWGLVNIVLAVLEEQASSRTKIEPAGLLGTPNTIVINIFKRAFHTSVMSDNKVGVQTGIENAVSALAEESQKAAYKELRKLGSTLHSGHVMGNYYSKTSKIIGKSLNSAGPSETLDLLMGHFCL